MSWIETYTGRKVYPLNPDPATIDIEDIVHALSNMCRFTGHCKRFYSVAEHSLWIEKFVQDDDNRRAALLHDAAEAYIADVARPIKYELGIGEFESKLLSAIGERFDVTLLPLPDEVKHLDDVMLATEAYYLMPSKGLQWEALPKHKSIPQITEERSIASVKKGFMSRCERLGIS